MPIDNGVNIFVMQVAILKTFYLVLSQRIIIKYKQMMSSIQQYDDIQKIQSFIITISSKPKTITETLYQQKYQRASTNVLEDLQKHQLNHPINSKFYQSSIKNSKASVADLALRKIQYRTRLHQNVQRCAQMKQKCELLINHSPYKAKNWSSGCLKKRNSNHKSQVKIKWQFNFEYKNQQKRLNSLTKRTNQATSTHHQSFSYNYYNQQYPLKILSFQNIEGKIKLQDISRAVKFYFILRSQKNKTIYTLKIFKKAYIPAHQIQNLIKQLKIQSFTNHFNLIKVIHITHDRHFLYVFYDAVTMPSLSQQIKQNGPFFEKEVRRILKQICLAVDYLQKNNIFHQNICPESIYCQEGMVKLGEFHKSDYISPLRLSSKSKSQGSLKQKSWNFHKIDKKIDIWNIGILAYELLFGCPPIQLQQSLKQNKKRKQTIYFSEEIDVSNTAKQFIVACLEKNPEKRLGIKQIIEHGFLKGGEKYRWTTL